MISILKWIALLPFLIAFESASYGDEDLAFFEELDSKISLFSTKDENRTFKFFMKEVSKWMQTKQTLSAREENALKTVALKMKDHHLFSGQVLLSRIISIIDGCENPSSIDGNLKAHQLRRLFKQYSQGTFRNSFSSGLPKVFKNTFFDFLSTEEVFVLQSLSKASYEESASWLNVDFPEASFPFTELSNPTLEKYRGYSTTLQYKELTFPIAAVRLLIQSHILDQQNLSDDELHQKAMGLRAIYSNMKLSFLPQSLAHRFISGLEDVLMTPFPFEQPEMAEVLQVYDLFSTAGYPYATELMALASACEKDGEGNPDLRVAKGYLARQRAPTIGLTKQKPAGRALSPTAKELIDYLELKQAPLPLVNQRNQIVLIAESSWSTVEDQRLAGLMAFNALDYSEAIKFYKLVANTLDATQQDKRYLATAAYRTKNYNLALFWYEALALSQNASMDAQRMAARSAYYSKDFSKGLHWSELVVENPEHTWDDKQALALNALGAKEYRKSSDCFEVVANDPKATDFEKRYAGVAALESHHYLRAMHWYGILANSPEADLNDQRFLAKSAAAAEDIFKALHWYEVVSNHPESIKQDKLNAAYMAYRAKLFAKAFRLNERLIVNGDDTHPHLIRAAAYAAYQVNKVPQAYAWFSRVAKTAEGTAEDQRMIKKCLDRMYPSLD